MTKKEFEQARKESIKKWTNVLYNDVYFSCGFCTLVKGNCSKCAVCNTCQNLYNLEFLPHEVLAMAALDWLLWDCTWDLVSKGKK